MNIPHEQFCVLPWVSLEASPIGTVRPCCLADDELCDNSGTKFNLATANFKDIQNSDQMKTLRSEFLSGQQPATCRKCWNEEDAGRTSKRMHTLNRLRHMGIGDVWTVDAKPLMFLDLKLGNICNLKCRICGSWSSSQFAIEDIQHDKSGADKKQTFAYQMLRAGAWPEKNQQFWSEIDGVLTDIRYIEFTGGEPFMIAEHFAMLQGIVDRGIAHNVEIHYNTNGTQYPEHAIDIWKHFRTVEIAFSIDDVGERFEYQRSNAEWTDVLKNISRFKSLREQHKNIQLQVCSTINIFNVRYLKDVSSWIAAQNFDFVYWNIMHDAWYFSISRLPEQAKLEIAAYLRNMDPHPQYREEFDRVIDFMMQGESSDGEEMRENIRKLDVRRNQNLQIVAPELAKVINYAKT
jgi:MoaA/NifB/PqqE/SkfB family radical SAM enzyme